MSISLMTAAFKTSLPQVQKFVLVALCDNANDQGECYPSVPMLAVKCSLTDRAIRKALVALEQSRHIARSHRAGRSTLFQVSDPGTWFTPEQGSALNKVHPTPEQGSPPPLNVVQVTPERGSAITINESLGEPSVNQKQARGTRLPKDWSLTEEHRAAAKAIKPDWSTEYTDQVAATFRDYWISQPGAKGSKMDWLATWRNWCRNDRGPSRGVGGKPSRHDLRGIDYNAGVNADGSF